MFVLLSITYTVEYVVLANTSAFAIRISSADTIPCRHFLTITSRGPDISNLRIITLTSLVVLYLNFSSSDDNLTESCKIITLVQ